MAVATAAAIIGGVVSLAGSAMASNTAAKGRKAAGDAAARGAAAFDAAEIPGVEEQKALLEEFKVTGQYTPEMRETFGLDPSAMEQVGASPEVIKQQEDALEKMTELAEGGYSEGDKAAMREVKNEVNQNARARQKSILNEMAQRGVLGSGMELAAQLKGEQQSVDAEATASNQAIQQAQARSLQALGQQGVMASKLRSQDVGEQSDIARAKDAISKFNTANRQTIAGQNVGERNRAQTTNLAAQQAASDANTRMRNQNEVRNRELLQQQFQNQMAKAKGQAGVYKSQGEQALASSKQQAGAQAGMAGAVGNIAGAFMKSGGEDAQRKQDQQDAIDNLD